MSCTHLIAWLALVLAAACFDASPRGEPPPLVGGKADDGSSSSSDLLCRIVTRSASTRSVDASGRGNGPFTYEVTVEVDVRATELASASALLSYATSDTRGDWLPALPTEIAEEREGMARHRFQLFTTEQTNEAATFVAFIPYLQDFGGKRLYDHNRLHGDTDHYRLDGYRGWFLDDVPGLCAPPTDACDGRCGAPLEGPLPVGFVYGQLVTQVCPRNDGAAEPYTCAIVVRDGARRIGLLLRYGGDPAAAEPTLACLQGSLVAVETTGVLEDFDVEHLRTLVGPVDVVYRFGGNVAAACP